MWYLNNGLPLQSLTLWHLFSREWSRGSTGTLMVLPSIWPWQPSIRSHLLNTATMGTKHLGCCPLREKPHPNHSNGARMYSWQVLLAALETYLPTLPGLPFSSVLSTPKTLPISYHIIFLCLRLTFQKFSCVVFSRGCLKNYLMQVSFIPLSLWTTYNKLYLLVCCHY